MTKWWNESLLQVLHWYLCKNFQLYLQFAPYLLLLAFNPLDARVPSPPQLPRSPVEDCPMPPVKPCSGSATTSRIPPHWCSCLSILKQNHPLSRGPRKWSSRMIRGYLTKAGMNILIMYMYHRLVSVFKEHVNVSSHQSICFFIPCLHTAA